MVYGNPDYMRFNMIRTPQTGTNVGPFMMPSSTTISSVQGHSAPVLPPSSRRHVSPVDRIQPAVILTPRSSPAGQFAVASQRVIASAPKLPAPVDTPTTGADSAEDISAASKDTPTASSATSQASPKQPVMLPEAAIPKRCSPTRVRSSPSPSSRQAVSPRSMASKPTDASSESSMLIAYMVGSQTLKLATEGAAPEYIEQAEQILKNGDAGLMAAHGTEGFVDAMKRQGLVLADMQANSPLCFSRRVALCAAVLHEMDIASSVLAQQEGKSVPPTPRSPCSPQRALSPKASSPSSRANVLKEQLLEQRTKSLERMWRSAQHRLEAKQRQDASRRATSERHAKKAEEEQRQVRRVQERVTLEKAARRMRSESLDGKYKRTLSRGAEIEEARKVTRMESCAKQAGRSRQRVEQYNEDIASRKQMLRNRFQLVDNSSRRAHQEKETKAQTQAAKLHQKMSRSADHLESCRLSLDLKQQQKNGKEHEREHQVLRMKRLRDFQRFVRIEEFKKDSAIYNDCRQERGRTQGLLTLTADRASLGYSPPLPQSLKSLADVPASPGQQSG